MHEGGWPCDGEDAHLSGDSKTGEASGAATAAVVADTIRALVETGGLKAGDRIGAERELAERLGVTRWLVRRALDQLEQEELILRTHGRSGGVFVAHPKVVRDLEHLTGLPQYLQAQGLESGTTVLGTRVVAPDVRQREVLELTPEDWVFQVDRLRFADGIPLNLETVWLRADLFPGLLDRSLVGSLYELVENDYGIVRGDARETITAVGATREQAAPLKVVTGTPLLAVVRVARTADGQPFETSQEFYRADRVEIAVDAHSDTGERRLIRTPPTHG